MTVIEKLENNIAEVNSAFQNIKSKIVESGVDVAENTRPIELAPKVNEVFEAGKKAEYDAFWESIQQGGNQKNYNYMFGSKGWNDTTFKPKYDIKPSWSCVALFRYSAFTDLEKILNECGVTLDLSDNGNYTELFYGSSVAVIPEITFGGFSTTVGAAFQNCTSLHTIRKIILKEGFNADMSNCFANCTALENVVFEGVIPKHIYTQWCTKLSKASIISIIEHLSTTASGFTANFSKTAVETAFGSAESAEWQSLIAPKSNWTISLV